MKYFIVAGEASGDLHGANLAKAIAKQDAHAQLVGWGGEKMELAGVSVQKHYDDLAIMGFVEVLSKLPTIFKNLRVGVETVTDFQPDAVILIDFSGFNLRFAKQLRKKGYTGKMFYYISPKLWAWNKKRVKIFQQYIDAVFCILPFEVDFYALNNYNEAYYIGNPLLDEISVFTPNPNFKAEHNLTEQPIVALLPGSRAKEIELIFPVLLKLQNHFPDVQFVVAGVKSNETQLRNLMKQANTELPIVFNETYDVIHAAKAAVVTSGTATLETALLNTPLVLCYKGNQISFLIARALVNIDFIGLPNLILNQEMVKEFIQSDCTEEKIASELRLLLTNEQRRNQFFEHQSELSKRVGEPGASEQAAKIMLQLLNRTETNAGN